MNFFESQDRARRKTSQLIFLFLLATLSLVVITNLLLLAVSGAYTPADGSVAEGVPLTTHLMLSLGVLAVIGVASMYKIAKLSGGGEVVATSLGGRLLSHNTTDFHERRVLNVVEEMAIAAGLPVPPVYVLDDDALNAFAAGFHADDAVIGLTRGCVRFLNREELQGVVAHEFSHILHGDMRINIRLIGVLFGILVIGNIGYFLFRTSAYRPRSSNDRNGLPLVFVGLGLIVIGYVGTFFGNLIKASVSRQREFLADASAVQYTRNPEGIGNALRKIGGFRFGSRLMAPNAAEASHLFIGQAIKLSSLMATHPPLEQRISRILPDWNGEFIDTEAEFRVDVAERQRQQHFGDSISQMHSDAPLEDIEFSRADAGPSSDPIDASVLESVGEIQQGHIDYAQSLLARLQGDVLNAVHSPNGARAAIYCLLLSADEAVQARQMAVIRDSEDPYVEQFVDQLLSSIRGLGVEYRIPIVDLCLPVLKTQYEDQHRQFRQCVLALMRADQNIDLFEWCLHRMFVRHLDSVYDKARRSKVRFSSLNAIRQQCDVIIAAVAACAGDNDAEIRQAYTAARAELEGFDQSADFIKPSLNQIDAALADACALAPLEKPRLIKACATSVLADGEIKPKEYELIRAIADSMDVPMPPRLAQQAVF